MSMRAQLTAMLAEEEKMSADLAQALAERDEAIELLRATLDGSDLLNVEQMGAIVARWLAFKARIDAKEPG